MPDDDQGWIDRARTLLSPQNLRLTLNEAPADPDPGDIGAVAGFGAVADDRDVLINAYVFEEWGDGHDHIEALTQRAEAQGRKSLAIVDGQLLIFATAGTADRDQFGLFEVSTAFSRHP